MGYLAGDDDDDNEQSLNLDLSIILIPHPSKPRETPSKTPPITSSVSVPFQWEEAPGKPRPCPTNPQSKPKASRCLELPPRLLNQAKVANVPSPCPTTTALDHRHDEPYKDWSLLSNSLSCGLRRSASVTENWDRKTNKDRLKGTSGRWRNAKKKKEGLRDGFDELPCSVTDRSDAGISSSSATTKVCITRIRRRSSFSGFTSTRSHLWTSISASFKQVVPWKRSKRN